LGKNIHHELEDSGALKVTTYERQYEPKRKIVLHPVQLFTHKKLRFLGFDVQR